MTKKILIDIKNYISKKEYNEDNKSIILDEITPLFLSLMNKQSDIEKHIIYALIKRPKRVLKEDMTKKDLSNYLTTKDLSDELRMETKELSVYMKRLYDKNLLKRRKEKGKYKYKIKNQYLIDWFLFRHK